MPSLRQSPCQVLNIKLKVSGHCQGFNWRPQVGSVVEYVCIGSNKYQFSLSLSVSMCDCVKMCVCVCSGRVLQPADV